MLPGSSSSSRAVREQTQCAFVPLSHPIVVSVRHSQVTGTSRSSKNKKQTHKRALTRQLLDDENCECGSQYTVLLAPSEKRRKRAIST